MIGIGANLPETEIVTNKGEMNSLLLMDWLNLPMLKLLLAEAKNAMIFEKHLNPVMFVFI